MGAQLPSQGAQPPNFWPISVVAKWLDGLRCHLVDLGPGDFVLDENPAPLHKKGWSPQFSSHVCRCQMAGWIKMPLGMEVGLGPGDIVLDGGPAPLPGGTAPQFLAHICCVQMAGWIKMPLVMEVGIGPCDCVRWGPSSPPQKGGRAGPSVKAV